MKTLATAEASQATESRVNPKPINTGPTSAAQPVKSADPVTNQSHEQQVSPPSINKTEISGGVESTAQQAPKEASKQASRQPATTLSPAKPVVEGGVLPLHGDHWVDILRALQLSGVTQSVASSCAMTQWDDSSCTLVLNSSHASLSNKNHEKRIEKALSEYYGQDIRLNFELGEANAATPAEIEADRREQARLAAVDIIRGDKNVQKLIESFDGTLDTDSIEARQHNGT